MERNHTLYLEIVRHRYTITSFAEALGMRVASISEIINRRHYPSRATIEKITGLLGKSREALELEPFKRKPRRWLSPAEIEQRVKNHPRDKEVTTGGNQ